jgi:hypothetical protein
VTVAQHRNTGLHFDKTLLGGRQVDSPGEKKSGESLHMAAAQPAMRPEAGWGERPLLHGKLILGLSF